MKNKPHPRWAQKPPGNQVQDQHFSDEDPVLTMAPTETLRDDDRRSNTVSDHGLSVPANAARQMNAPSIQLTPITSSPEALMACESPVTPQDPHFLGTFNIPTPPNSSSSSSPVHYNRMLPHVVMNDRRTISPSVFHSVDGLLASACMESTGFEDGIYGQMLDHILRTDQAGTVGTCSRNASCSQACSCINSAAVYNSLLELSIRLRKAVESLGEVPDHSSRTYGLECQLFTRIRDLDKLTS